MAARFEDEQSAAVPASPADVWDAIATGPGVDSWFMGVTNVDGGVGGQIRTTRDNSALESIITTWEPEERLTHRVDGPEGRFVCFDYLIEGRDGGSTTLRLVTSGFLPGDDWEAEYEAMTSGRQLYFQTLVTYLSYFAGRFALPITAIVDSPNHGNSWDSMLDALGVNECAAVGDKIVIAVERIPMIRGVIDYRAAQAIGVRTDSGLYRFHIGFFGPCVAHHVFEEVDRKSQATTWRHWLMRLCAADRSLSSDLSIRRKRESESSLPP